MESDKDYDKWVQNHKLLHNMTHFNNIDTYLEAFLPDADEYLER